MLSYPHDSQALKTFLETELNKTDLSLQGLEREYYLSILTGESGSVQDLERKVLIDKIGSSPTGTNHDLWQKYLDANSLSSIDAWITAGGFATAFDSGILLNGGFDNDGLDNWNAISFGEGSTEITTGDAVLLAGPTVDQAMIWKFTNGGARGVQSDTFTVSSNTGYTFTGLCNNAGAGDLRFQLEETGGSTYTWDFLAAGTTNISETWTTGASVTEAILRVRTRNNSTFDSEISNLNISLT